MNRFKLTKDVRQIIIVTAITTGIAAVAQFFIKRWLDRKFESEEHIAQQLSTKAIQKELTARQQEARTLNR